jgi:predicted metal-dependent phosphoesterase TrpH
VSRYVREDQARRLEESRKLLGVPVLVGDVHSHSTYSDGTGTMAENWEMARAAGLDFLFVTDHETTRQKSDCIEAGQWWGQESASGGHHMVLLGASEQRISRDRSVAESMKRARREASFVFIPHPVGWWPDHWYPRERAGELAAIDAPFAVEVMNGANKIDRAFDKFDRQAIVEWDRCLQRGQKVAALGGSDAHLPQGIGCVWTVATGVDLAMESVLEALAHGHCFASEGPLINLKSDDMGQGDTVTAPSGSLIEVEVTAAYAGGLLEVSVIRDGRIIKKTAGRESTIIRERLSLTVASAPSYLRVACRGSDDRRAFSSPMYMTPSGHSMGL